MSSEDWPAGLDDNGCSERPLVQRASMECELLESLIHVLMEKGVMTKNDALSVVQTVAEVKQGSIEDAGQDADVLNRELRTLKRLYKSFELVRERRPTSHLFDGGKITRLRPPVHGDQPEFPEDG